MKSILKINYNAVLMFLTIFLLLQGLMIAHEAHGNDHAFSWGKYEKNLPSADKTDAVLDVREFFSALCEGNVDIIREMMDEGLQEEYRLSLNDPSYPDLLRKIYGGSKIIIDHIDRKEAGAFVVEAKLITPKSGTNRVIFEIEEGMEKRRGYQSRRLRSFAVKH